MSPFHVGKAIDPGIITIVLYKSQQINNAECFTHIPQGSPVLVIDIIPENQNVHNDYWVNPKRV